MKTNNTFFFFICLFTQIILGQVSNEKKIHGLITADSTLVEGINIVNLTTDKRTSSNKEGVFNLFVKEGDLLSFSAVNLVTLRRRITKEDVLKESIAIKILSNSIPLKEVIVNENAQINAENLGIIPEGQKKYTPAERKLYTSRSGLLDRPLNWISGRTSMLKKEVAIEYKEQLMNRLEYLFEDKYYTQTLKIPEEYIKGFQYYCIENTDFEAALRSKNKTLSMFLIITLAEKYNKIITDEN